MKLIWCIISAPEGIITLLFVPIKGQESKSTPFIDLKFLNLRWGVAYAYQILNGTFLCFRLCRAPQWSADFELQFKKFNQSITLAV